MRENIDCHLVQWAEQAEVRQTQTYSVGEVNFLSENEVKKG